MWTKRGKARLILIFSTNTNCENMAYRSFRSEKCSARGVRKVTTGIKCLSLSKPDYQFTCIAQIQFHMRVECPALTISYPARVLTTGISVFRHHAFYHVDYYPCPMIIPTKVVVITLIAIIIVVTTVYANLHMTMLLLKCIMPVSFQKQSLALQLPQFLIDPRASSNLHIYFGHQGLFDDIPFNIVAMKNQVGLTTFVIIYANTVGRLIYSRL